ncbi:uncharacterized protein LOC122501869 [Leptopilina heterotoma]|uniref:uncharacterized protein LOC122501869 n=1 Tax=Leptopilina heterotoma TaxID=63436 RepID=UPI001CA9D54A|nr:uncharacterized protein LOC122501869 [Leptopilina heterotoma]
MPNVCAVAGCKNKYDKNKPALSMFTFPKTEFYRKQWLKVCKNPKINVKYVECPKDYVPNNNEVDLLESLEKEMAVEKMAEEGLKYIAGYVAYRFGKDDSLGCHTSRLTEQPDNDWICHLSKGYLKYPSDKLLVAAKIMEEEFQSFHGLSFSKENKIYQKVANKVSDKLEDKLDIKVLLCLRFNMVVASGNRYERARRPLMVTNKIVITHR